MHRIAFVGSFSTGKTTLAHEIANESGLPLLPEVAREVIDLGFKLDQDATPEMETLVFLKQYRNELVHPTFVSDRSLIDVLAYAGWVIENQDWRKETALWDACVDVAQHHLRSQYSHVFYLPIEFAPVDDGVRSTDPEWQKEVDVRMIDVMRKYDIPHETLTGSVDERLDQVRNQLER